MTSTTAAVSFRTVTARLSPLVAVLAVVALCGVVEWTRLHRERSVLMSPAVAAHMADGRVFAARLIERVNAPPASAITESDAIVANYLERLRVGLGSPFRLIDQLMRDPLVDDSVRSRAAYALLDRTLLGDAYHAEPAALAAISPDGSLAVGAQHRDLIDRVVSASDDPRGGELSVRLAYRLAASARTTTSNAPGLAAQAAALARDRVLASRDARLLLETAMIDQVDPLQLLPLWRTTRKFSVERPVMAAPGPAVERQALFAVRPVVSAIDAIAAHSSAERAGHPSIPAEAGTTGSRAESAVASNAPYTVDAARRIAWFVERRAGPPQAQVTVMVETVSGSARSYARVEHPTRRFLDRSRNEESLAAEYALFAALDSTRSSAPALTTLLAANSLRGLAQEPVWFPGDAGPNVSELKDRFGFASISFDETVPTAWRPYLMRMLALGVTDLQRVFPALSVRGLGVHFGESPLGRAALALHDPATRTIYLPPATSAGVLAHELAHDLDWQVARERYSTIGTYSTDRALRQETNDRFAASVRQLATGGVPAGDQSARRVAESRRPTEVFARNVDWFVGAALAHEGRSNGYLTTAQDIVLSGYGAVIPPEVSRDGGEAMVRVLDEMTRVPRGTRSWFLDAYGPARLIPPTELANRVLDASPGSIRAPARVGGFAIELPRPSAETLAMTLAGSRGEACDATLDRGLAVARGRLVLLAAESRAEGIVRARAERAARDSEAPWRARALAGAPWDERFAHETWSEVRDALLSRAVRSDRTRGVAAVVHASPLGAIVCPDGSND
ncbi:MAG TPA: hypothetical protein VFG84_10715 [Gemmatimonadaceae bacterium]|nr:hypothetical protein [Gemmatimonadaceae bacterium]